MKALMPVRKMNDCNQGSYHNKKGYQSTSTNTLDF